MNIIDDITYRLIEKALNELEVKVDEVVKVSQKDRERLILIARSIKPLTYREWGEVLGMSREGAYYLLKRLRDQGLVKMVKEEKGVKIELEDKAKRITSIALKSLLKNPLKNDP